MKKTFWIALFVVAFGCVIGYLVIWKTGEAQSLEIDPGTAKEPDRRESREHPATNPATTMLPTDDKTPINEDQDQADGVASIADLQLPLHFEQGSVPEEVQSAIEVDLEAMFSTMSSHRRDKLIVDGVEREWVTFEGGADELADVVREEFGAIEQIGGREFFRVSKDLSDAYQKALEFRQDHDQEYNKLTEVVDRLRGMESRDMGSSGSPNAPKVIVRGAKSDEIQSHIIKLLADAEFRGPSLLELGLQEYEKAEVLTAKLHVTDSPNGSSGEIFFIFVDGEWAAVFGTPGT